ncbi:sensor histidine kinase [Anaeromyxobacter dehalogenans]|uniref:histidine kinase n=1 Tax=Anaeromyxobacter dehalogenans (strain 2CP-C) TaxID=290397 RepID=Q2IEU8_ANADE|nr:HAMP domain-containing sensor histidine kinase [Anaeromyxobacter dehalogenans]ABC83109.1 periplasmic sensor signal transduction histidine kinase [Anaeromyxobacter dehalogenans 2CP-C]
MTLRTKLALAFSLFAAVPLAATLVPVSRALGRALTTEHAARLDGAAAAVQKELARLGEHAAGAVTDLSRAPELEALARDRAADGAELAEAAARAGEWMGPRGLDVLAVLEADGRVVSSGHLPGRAGDPDPELADLPGAARPGRAVPRVVSRAGPEGVEPVLALVAWAPGPGEPPLRVAGGVALTEARAARLAALTGGAVVIRSADGEVVAAASAEAPGPARGWRRLRLLFGGLSAAPRRTIALGPADAPVARVEVSLASEGLARAETTVLLAFLGALAAGVAAAATLGAVLAARITRPLEGLRAAAARVAGGDLAARVDVRAGGEVGELVRAFNAMTQDLAQGRVRLAQAERIAAWREVARRLAHEIKNPLTPIAMSVETLREAHAQGRADFPEIFDEGTQAIGEEVRRLKRIVDEFSRFARLPAPERAEVPAEELAAAVLALFPAAPPGVEVERAIAPDLPAVLADRDQVMQVLLNLVRNALDAMPSGGRLRLAAYRDRDAVAFEVSDSGPGIAPGDLERVFEPYFTTKPGGTGLGLAIARRIAEEHGGALDAASSPGAGATFTLRLPVARPQAQAARGA